ncbi:MULTISPECIES: hypothetical protein [unclassified Frankia]|uniref:hypothetical protein n=1 Tax=unclassified Frankia TaxID=2632575 RepID=UPI001EE44E23|nr:MULTISPECIES: hypothetical protein [unclassified Frankia]
MIDVDGGADGLVTVELPSFSLPAVAGVLVAGLDPDPRSGVRGSHCAGIETATTLVPDGDGGLLFVPAHPYPPEAVARRLGATRPARALVVCPRLVSPGRTILSLVVARLLADRRGSAVAGQESVVACGARPRCAWESGEVVLPHLVSVVTPGSVRLRVVWEIIDLRRLPTLLASRRPSGVEPVAVTV